VSAGRTARRALIAGRVQGVFFRDAVRVEAERAGVSGWAANRNDGRVEAWLEGDPAAVERLVAWCRDGAPGRVDSVDVEVAEPEGLNGFEVR
jgi:acylphosphatase